jgi:opacity protein-like surface antigen
MVNAAVTPAARPEPSLQALRAKNHRQAEAQSLVAFNTTKTYAGWTLGAGVEWAFWDRWSAKAEYLYIDFGNGPTVALTPAFTLTTNHLTDNIGRVGVNYRF